MLENISVAKYLYRLLTEEKLEHRKTLFMKECGETRIVLLWQILFETDMKDTDVLNDRIYRYGSMLREKDYLGREIFLCLVALLNLVIK